MPGDAHEQHGTAGSSSDGVVIAHDFAETFGGAERVLAAMAAAFPQAPVWAIAGRREVAERMGIADRFHTLLPENERLLRHYRALAPAYQQLVRMRSLPAAGVLLSSSYGFAHGFRTRNRAPQVCFCHSPLRFAWSMTDEYAERFAGGRVRSAAFGAMAAGMRRSDRAAAKNVDTYLAGSVHVAGQIRSAYGVDAKLIRPPIDCDRFHPSTDPGHDGYYLFCGRLIEPYKRVGIVIDAFRDLPLKLLIAGDGPAYAELAATAPDNVEFRGHVEDAELVPLMQRCAATIFPSVDDFGLIPVETMACGRPVIAFAGGGALETVIPGQTGEFFGEPTATDVRAAVERFDPDSYSRPAIRSHAEQWDLPGFQRELAAVVASQRGG